MTQKNFRFIFTIYFIAFGLAITLFSSFVEYWLHSANMKAQSAIDAQTVAYVKRTNVLKPSIERMDAVVLSLASNKLLNEYILKPTDTTKQNLLNIFYAVAASDRLIMQARFIDKNGMEKIRVDRTKESDIPFVVPDEKLQDKSDRDYFQIVSKMKTNTVWRSKLDLNIENKKIEIPYRPTIRGAIPIFKNGAFEGMVIVNMLTNELLNGMKLSPQFEHFVIDKEGGFILHPNDNYSWSRYAKNGRALSDDFGVDASAILSGKMSGDGYHVFTLSDILKNDDGAMLVLREKKEYSDSLVHSNIKTALIVELLSALISIPLAMYLAVTPSKLQRALLASNIELKRFAEIIDRYVITATTKTNSIITAVSSAFSKTSGYPKEELVGQSINIVKHPDTPKELFADMWNHISSGNEWQGEMKNRKKDGGEYWLDQTIIPIKNDQEEVVSYVSIGVDISAKKELEKISAIDKLTGVMTRRKLDEFICVEVEKAHLDAKPLSFILVDIDFFKKVNDTYGHQVGDYVLKTTAGLLDYHIKKSDMIGRYGGEEFLIICPDTDKESATVLAEKLRKTVLEHTFDIVGQKSISLGVAQLAAHECGDEILRRADNALYEAKNGGRNRVITTD